MTPIIYHNPKCSKSRATKDILTKKKLDITVVEYLKTPPDANDIQEILKELGLSARELMRTGEAEYKEQNLAEQMDENRLIEAMVKTPKLIERPIVRTKKGTVIGRPPENVLNIL
jgi:arsenate reductase